MVPPVVRGCQTTPPRSMKQIQAEIQNCVAGDKRNRLVWHDRGVRKQGRNRSESKKTLSCKRIFLQGRKYVSSGEGALYQQSVAAVYHLVLTPPPSLTRGVVRA